MRWERVLLDGEASFSDVTSLVEEIIPNERQRIEDGYIYPYDGGRVVVSDLKTDRYLGEPNWPDLPRYDFSISVTGKGSSELAKVIYEAAKPLGSLLWVLDVTGGWTEVARSDN
jgi:hypothetical protein